ncbi:MAG TPA: hypothetical protein VKY19_07115 [Ktedonosporobacter sp.]|nr:hypothetical protein [Ktedonosporobacter sp.]
MKRSDTGDFCVLYIEADDDRTGLFHTVSEQQKPVVIMLAEHTRVFQRPEDFTTLKHVKRQLDKPVVFVIPDSERMTQMAARNGFPVYASMDTLSDALMVGQLSRQRVLTRTTAPLGSGPNTAPIGPTIKKTTPLPPLEEILEEEPCNSEQQRRYRASFAQSLGEEVSLQRPAPRVAPLPRQAMPLPTPPAKPRRRGRAMIVLTIITLLVAVLSSLLVLFYKFPMQLSAAAPVAPAAPAIVGKVALLSSGQLSENSSQGIADQVLIDLHNLPNPAPQKSYYAWLLGDKLQSDAKTVFLGKLPVSNGTAHLLYPGDAAHTNLLQSTSRFLVTEEDASVQPIAPSPDQSVWRFYGEFSQTPINSPDNPKHFSYLDHLRHLLAADPTLDALNLPGGLNDWFYRNSGKIVEWAGSLREQWEESKDVAFVRRQTVRILTYLDGMTYVQMDVPPGTPLNITPRLASIGLLTVNGPNQEPASYLIHIVNHLNGLLQAGGSTPELRKDEAAIITAMNNVEDGLSKVRSAAQQIMKMTDQQLRQPQTLTLINDMIDNANRAYAGQIDPTTGQMREGVTWVHDNMQSLAVMSISKFSASGSSIQMMPGQPRGIAPTDPEALG